eukprot:c25948_g1_i1 orf=392-1537(-)
MPWIGFAYAAAAAVGNSCIDGSRKLATQRFSPVELVGLVGLLDAVVLSSAVFGSGKFGSPQSAFRGSHIDLLRILVASAGVKVIANFLYQRALHVSPLSVTVPYLAFTPVLLVFTSFFLMNEMPSSQGLMGIVIVTVGGYLLAIGNSAEGEIKKSKQSKPNVVSTVLVSALPKWRSRPSGLPLSEQGRVGEIPDNDSVELILSGDKDERLSDSFSVAAGKEFRWPFREWAFLGNVFEPLLALRREEGSLLMLGVAGLLSVSNSLDKMGAHLAPSSIVFAAIQKIIMAIPLVLFLGVTSPRSFKHLFRQFPILAAISLFEVVAFICYLKSMETLLVSYSVAAKRSNVLISVVIGRVVFKERIWRRMPSILLMAGGMTLIAFA